MEALSKADTAAGTAGTCDVPGCRVWVQGGAAGLRAHKAVVHDFEEVERLF